MQRFFGLPTPIADLRLETANEIKAAKNKLFKLPLSPLKKEIIGAIFNYIINRVENAGILRLITTDMESRTNTLKVVSKASTEQTDDEFLKTVKKAHNNLPKGSELKVKMSHAILKGEHNLNARRESTRNTVLKVAAISTGLTLLIRPAAGIILLAAEVTTLLKVDLGKLLNQALEVYDSTRYMDVKNPQTDEVEHKLMTSYLGFKK